MPTFRSLISLILITGVALFPIPASAAEQSPPPIIVAANTAAKTGEALGLNASGPHFVYIMFKELQADLEKHIGKPINLHGKDSMFGVGCSAGIKMAASTAPDNPTFGFACCPLAKDEIEKYKLDVTPLAMEPIMIITHKSNPIKSLTTKQIRGMFSGKIKNWREVGGEDKKIVVVTRLHCGKRPGHWKTILPKKDDFTKDRINVKGAEPMVRTVSDFGNSIGHVGSGWKIQSTDKIKIIKVNGYEPNPKNLKAKKYPFFRIQSIFTSGPPSSAVKSTIDFMKNSKEYREVAAKYKMLPIE